MTATVQPTSHVNVDHPDEVVMVIATDARSTYVRHVPPRRSLGPDGWDMAMRTDDFERWFAEVSQ